MNVHPKGHVLLACIFFMKEQGKQKQGFMTIL